MTRELDAIADPQPNVLNFASSITPESLIFNWSFITSPHAGAPTIPVPTVGSVFSNEKRGRGGEKRRGERGKKEGKERKGGGEEGRGREKEKEKGEGGGKRKERRKRKSALLL